MEYYMKYIYNILIIFILIFNIFILYKINITVDALISLIASVI